MNKINENVKKILLIGIPIILVMIAVSLIFYTKANDFKKIQLQTTDNELIAYAVESGTFKSEETVESSEDNKQYQTKVIIELYNKAKYDLGYFDISVQFVEENNDEIWTYTQEDFSFYTDGKLIVSSIRPYKATAIKNVYINFSDNDKQVYLHNTEEYDKLFGEDNKIISPATLKIYNTLTVACIIFTLVIALAISSLILVYTRPEEDELLIKISTKSKKSGNNHSTTQQKKPIGTEKKNTLKEASTTSTISKNTLTTKKTSSKASVKPSSKSTNKK